MKKKLVFLFAVLGIILGTAGAASAAGNTAGPAKAAPSAAAAFSTQVNSKSDYRAYAISGTAATTAAVKVADCCILGDRWGVLVLSDLGAKSGKGDGSTTLLPKSGVKGKGASISVIIYWFGTIKPVPSGLPSFPAGLTVDLGTTGSVTQTH